MPWKEVSTMSSRREFVVLASAPEVNVRELCRRFSISPTTAYKWLSRGIDATETYEDRSRRPHRSPNRTEEEVEQLVLELRDAHPKWNARKIRRLLQRRIHEGQQLPAASTIGQILKRNGRITDGASETTHRWQRFEHPAPNDLSQIDFMGHFPTSQGRCYALTMLDDHSRYAQLLAACSNERTETVQAHLIQTFRRFGLPRAVNMDNGNPWGNPTGDPYTKLTVWMIRIGIGISHSRPLHPQTNGKDERFHRTVRAELIGQQCFASLHAVQRAFDCWREIYNHERPHEALALNVPASRYRPSSRTYPESLPAIEYNTTDLVQTIRHNGMLYVWKKDFYISQAFAGQPVALRPTAKDGLWDVYFCHKRIATVDRRDPRGSLNA
jgi:transposase InsO family protein